MDMKEIDVIDEAVIDASPSAVYKAILDEYVGVTNWWMPILEFKMRGNSLFCEGAICDIAARGSGMTAKFSVKVTKILQDKSIELELAGDFLGTEKWTFEPLDEKTKVQLRWSGKINKPLFSFVATFMKNPAKPHSDAIQKGFKILNSNLCKK